VIHASLHVRRTRRSIAATKDKAGHEGLEEDLAKKPENAG
jgi:hypothetical protein